MLSSVFLSGRLGERIDEQTRLVEVDSLLPTRGEFRVYNIPVRSSRSPLSSFFLAKKGSLIILKGRLEEEKPLGLYIALEIEEIYAPNAKRDEMNE